LISHILAKLPEYAVDTTTLMRDICAVLPKGVHLVCDFYYNTKGVCTLFNVDGFFFTMACNTAWLPHVFKWLHFKLPYNGKKFLIHPNHNNDIYVAYSSNSSTNTVSTAFAPVIPLIPPLPVPTIYEEYHRSFNMVDLFDRIYFLIEFPHRQHGWKSDFLDMIFKIALNNTWVLYNSTHVIHLTIEEFIERVSEELIVTEL
jgi:hypothetical protein